jgi:mRNA-degrading endonuclease YafQ of YafQ-DinJ toxin-antitoxin module
MAGFDRAARRLLKGQPESLEALQDVLAKLEEDAFQPSLKTHKLKGKWKDAWTCSAGYDLRVIFELGQRQGAEVISLLVPYIA